MRAFLFLVMVFQIIFGGIMLGSNVEQLQEIKLIRRAYLDVTGVVPTAEEIEWYIVYNNKGYELAIDYLFSKYDTKLIKEYLLSNAYKNQSKRRLNDDDLNKSLLYVVGMLDINGITEAKVKAAKQRLIEQALLCSDSSDDAIDYICKQTCCYLSTNKFIPT